MAANRVSVFDDELTAAGGKLAPEAIGNVSDAVVQFTRVEGYTTFLAEYAFVDGNIIIHFFPPREAYTQVMGHPKLTEEFALAWQRKFPMILSPTAEGYFKATLPVLSAQYIPEMQSWYMRAGGFALRLDPDAFVLAFFAKLDQEIDRATGGASWA